MSKSQGKLVEVEWFEDGRTGMSSSGTVWKPSAAVYSYLQTTLTARVALHPPTMRNVHGMFSPLRRTVPALSKEAIRWIENRIQKAVPGLLDKLLMSKEEDKQEKDQEEQETLFDFLFLVKLNQAKRKWKENCAICLTDEMKGTSCDCGHTEIVVFRPCGHSVCCDPCFVQLMQFRQIDLARTVRGDVKVPGNCSFPCPYCRTIVTRTFRAEEVRLPDNSTLLQTLADALAKDAAALPTSK